MDLEPAKFIEFIATAVFAAGSAYAGASVRIQNLGSNIDQLRKSVEQLHADTERSLTNAHRRIDAIYERTQKLIIERRDL